MSSAIADSPSAPRATPEVTNNAPIRSKEWDSRVIEGGRLIGERTRRLISTAAKPIGALTAKIQRQPAISVITPPRTQPLPPPSTNQGRAAERQDVRSAR